jgi:adenosylmethionine-8-amino-7-oxononanoate aminotransferase
LYLDFALFFSVALYPGAKGTFDGTNGDHIVIAPPFTITEEEILLLVDTLKISIDVILNAASKLA